MEAEVVKDVLEASASVSGGITGSATVKYDGTKNALVWSPSIKLEDIELSISATVAGVFTLSPSWTLVEGDELYDGSEYVIIQGPNKD